ALHVLHARPGHLADERLRLRDGPRSRLEELLDPAVHRGVEVVGRHGRADEADLRRAHRLEALARQEELAGRGLPDLPDDVGRDHGGGESPPGPPRPQTPAPRARPAVARGGRAGAPPPRPAPWTRATTGLGEL